MAGFAILAGQILPFDGVAAFDRESGGAQESYQAECGEDFGHCLHSLTSVHWVVETTRPASDSRVDFRLWRRKRLFSPYCRRYSTWEIFPSQPTSDVILPDVGFKICNSNYLETNINCDSRELEGYLGPESAI
jgi:hypothetical protein